MLMALVVLLSTMSFTIDKHYCGDFLVDTAIFKKAKTCGMKMGKSVGSDCETVKLNCCSDKQIVFDGQDELKKGLDQLSIEQPQLVAILIVLTNYQFNNISNKAIPFREYKPPLVVRQIYKLDESYLI